MRKTEYRHLSGGEWSAPIAGRFHKIECCDCCLVHLMEYKITGKTLKFRAWRDNRATANKRRASGKFPQENKRG